FGAGNRVFAITLEGTMAPGFPAYLEHKSLLPYSYPRIIEFDNEPMIILEEENQGFFAVDIEADIRFEYSYFWNKTESFNNFFWDEYSNRFFFVYSDASNTLYSSYLEGVYEDPVIWNGYRNDGYSLYTNSIDYQPDPDQKITAFAYPNPAKNGEVRIKVSNAQNNIDLKIFDIAGNIVFQTIQTKENNDDQDILWDTRKIASGLYFGIVKSNGSVKKIPIAIER
ncbi:MAG TPA: T9SS type A sorting domain-containing protein, partial [Candidatus Cloacimonetes bacterium]|nr:T9SS type A sorting domain-containing protein [Candidatus Cloacimonadota bacterium]